MIPFYTGYGLFTAGALLAIPADRIVKGSNKRPLGIMAGLLIMGGLVALGFSVYQQFV